MVVFFFPYLLRNSESLSNAKKKKKKKKKEAERMGEKEAHILCL